MSHIESEGRSEVIDTCRICGCTFSEASFGGPGVCPACDCGIPPVAQQRATIADLRRELAEARAENSKLQGWIHAAMAETAKEVPK